MVTKYGIFGAAFNGDGTVSTEAGSDGAAGAWKIDQTAGNILTGTAPTYGALAAGDTVHIRSKTGNGANANISNTLAASITLGSANATLANQITWILDDGTVWASQNGTLTYTTSSATFAYTLRQYNHFVAKTKHNWILENTNASPPSTVVTVTGVLNGLKVNLPSRTATSAVKVDFGTAGPHRDLLVSTLRTATGTNGGLITANQVRVRLLNPAIELLSATNLGAVFGATGFYGHFHIRGGRVYGAGATTGMYLAQANSSSNSLIFEALGLQVPKAMSLALHNSSPNYQVSLFGLDGGSGGALGEYWGTSDSRNIDNFYPTLNATLPDSVSSGVSWRLAPSTAVDQTNPAQLALAKLYSSAAATKTVTLEFLLANPWGGGSMNKKTVWMSVSYIDNATGEPRQVSSYDEDAAALDISTAAWSATTWGAVSFNKKKLAVTTPTSIKQDTAVVVTLFAQSASASANDVLMICPDVQLT